MCRNAQTSGLDRLNGGAETDTINGFTTGPNKDTINDTSFSFDFDELLVSLLEPM